MADVKWRGRGGGWRGGAVLFAILIQVVNGYEEMYTISQLSPKSMLPESPRDSNLEYSDNLSFNIEPSALFSDDFAENNEREAENIVQDGEKEDHVIVARSADPMGERESRSINIDEIPLSNNNEIDNELELHHKRKYYEILPTKTIDFLQDRDDIMFSSQGFGDRIDFKFQGEGERVPKGRALPLQGPKVRPTAVQPLFATVTPKEQGRQNNAEIQNIITGIVKLLNGNVNVQANSQLLRPGRPMNSRINNRGPPRIADAPNLPPDFEKPVTQFVPTKTPPPYPFDRPPHPHGIQIPEQIVPPVSTTPYRPGFHRPNLPPWHRPRPRPTPGRRPNPGLPSYKPNLPMPVDIPTIDLSEEKVEDEDILTLHDNESSNSENDVVKDETHEVTTEVEEVTEKEQAEDVTTEVIEVNTTTSSTTMTTESAKTTTEKETEPPTEKSTTPITTSTTEKPKEKPQKPEKEKKKDNTTEKYKDKYKINEEKQHNKTKNETSSILDILEASFSEKPTTLSIAAPTPTEGLPTHSPTVSGKESSSSIIKTSSINSQPLPSSQGIPHNPNPYRPRPGIVLDDPDFKPHGSRHRGEAAVITAAETRLPGGYGEIFDVTVSAIQGPGEKGGASVHIQNVSPHHGPGDPDDIIVSAVGEQGFVSIDGKRTYLNLFGDSSTQQSISPTYVVRPPAHSAAPPPPSPPAGTGVAVPADDTPQTPVRRPAQPVSRPQPPFRRPQPTVRIDTCIVGDDSTCDQAQNEKCRTEGGISSCQCRPGYARRVHRDPCRRVVALQLSLRVDKLYDRKVAWDAKLADKESEPYQQLSFEALRAIDSAFSMTPFSDDFVGGAVNSIHRGEGSNLGVFVNYTVLLQESPESLRSAVATDIQRHLLGVIRRRSNNIGASALWVDSPAGAVLAPNDVDECATPDLNDCHKLATCTNTWGGFRCTCPDSTRDTHSGEVSRGGRDCQGCAASHCNDRGSCHYANNQPYCSCLSGYYGSTCEVDGEVVGVAVGASLAAALVIALTLAALLSWSRKWSREQKAAGMGSPVFNYMAANTIKAPPVGQPPYQVTLEERMRWAQIAEAMAANHYAAESAQAMATRPSSAMFGGYPTLPPVPLPRTGLYMGTGHHNGTLNTVASRANTAASHHGLYGYTNHAATESTSSEASSRVQERADLLVPRPKSRARSVHNQTGIYYDVEYENAPEAIYGTKGIPLSTYTVSRGPPFYRT